jgi:hypothetical protein
MCEGNLWTLVRIAVWLILSPLLIVLLAIAVLIQIPLWLLGLRYAADTPEQVAAKLTRFLNGTEERQDWHEIEVELRDPDLDLIMRQAAPIISPPDPPLDEVQRAILTALIELALSLSDKYEAVSNEDRLKRIVRRYRIAREPIQGDMRLFHDLLITGDDAYELMVNIHKTFDTKFDEFPFEGYFPNQGEGLPGKLMKMKWYQRKWKELTFGHLLHVIEIGYWVQP